MNIVRKYKLSLIKYNSLTEKELVDLNLIFNYVKYCKENEEIINFIYNNLLNLKQVKLLEWSNREFWFKEDKCIMELNSDNCFGINYKLIWYVFETKFNYNLLQIRDLIKFIVINHYKLQNIIPVTVDEFYFSFVEKIYEHNKKN